MEKLIELLNEYEKVREKSEYQKMSNKEHKWFSSFYFPLCFWHPEGISGAMTNEFHEWAESVICSKKFWFIQWLVDNEKIKEEEYQFIWTDEMQYTYSKYENLLMLLSIQDNPIEFLISILK